MSVGRPGPRLRAVHVSGVLTAAASILCASGVVAQATTASLSSMSANESDGWSIGTVALRDDDDGRAVFAATDLTPGSTGSRCIEVTSDGSLDSDVRLYGTRFSTTNALASWLDVTVTLGTGGSFGGGCGGFVADPGPAAYRGTLAGLAAGSTGFSTGVGTWTPAGGTRDARVYRFDYGLNGSAPNSIQAGTASIDFVWESQNR